MGLVFIGPKQKVGRAAVHDWTQLRGESGHPVIVVVSQFPEETFIRSAAEAGVIICHYRDMDSLAELCRCQTDYLRRESLRRVPQFRGVVDGFVAPSTLSGWARLNGPDGLVGGLSVAVFKQGVLVAEGVPSIVRRDISGEDNCPTGFRIDCAGQVSARDIIDQQVSVFATDAGGNNYRMNFSDILVGALRFPV